MFERGLDSERVFGHHAAMGRTSVRRRIASAALVVGALAVAVPAAAGATRVGPASPPGVRYVVQPGDTVWGIAVALHPDADPREVADAIVSASSLDGAAIVPGQVLLVPARG